MFDFLIYLAQSSLCLAALYLIYKVAMSHETLHVFNRVILLGSVILSALLPLCRVKVVKEYDAAPTVASIEVDDMVLVENVPELGIDFVSLFKDIAVAAFVIGVAFMLVRLAVGIYSVWRLIHSGRVSVITDDVTLTVVSKLSTPFSLFGHIVASEEDMKVYRDMILSHELAHIRLRHSWDVLFVDLALCLWWFNPAMWLLRRELQSLHEYQADDAVLNEGVDAKNYQMLLIKRAAGARLHSVANCLNHSNLKNRITMMCKKNSSRWAAAKALLVLPVVAISLSAFATTVYVPREVQDKVTENSVNEQISQTESNASAMQESQQDDRPFIKVEKMPTFDGGKSMVGFQNWIQNNIRYPKEALAKGVGGRVIFQFVVERDGTPSSFNVLKSPDKSLADEVERIFKTCPKWEPGTQRGEKVRVLYTVPIVFAVQGGDTASSESLKAFNLAMEQIQKGDDLEKAMNSRNYTNAAEQKADQQKVNNYYKSAVGFLETAYQLDSKHKPTIQALQLATFRLRDEAGMMAKYEKYKAALEAL